MRYRDVQKQAKSKCSFTRSHTENHGLSLLDTHLTSSLPCQMIDDFMIEKEDLDLYLNAFQQYDADGSGDIDSGE